MNSWVHAVMDHLLSLVIIPAPGSFVLPWLDAGCVSCNLAWTPTSGCPFFLDFPLSGPSITEDSALLGLIHVLSVPRSHIHFLLTAGSSFSCQGSPSSGVSGQDHNVPNALGLVQVYFPLKISWGSRKAREMERKKPSHVYLSSCSSVVVWWGYGRCLRGSWAHELNQGCSGLSKVKECPMFRCKSNPSFEWAKLVSSYPKNMGRGGTCSIKMLS